MSKFRLGFLIAALFAVSVASGKVPPKPDDKKDPQEKFEPKGAPGAGQKFLARFVGDWKVEKTFFPRTPGVEPAES